MITINFILMRTNGPTETVSVTMDAVPRIHEFVQLSGSRYRVEDITHDIESRAIEVRAVA